MCLCSVCLSCVWRSSYNEPFAVMTKARFVHLPTNHHREAPKVSAAAVCCCCIAAESEEIKVFSFPNVGILLLNFSNCLGQVLYSRNKTDLFLYEVGISRSAHPTPSSPYRRLRWAPLFELNLLDCVRGEHQLTHIRTLQGGTKTSEQFPTRYSRYGSYRVSVVL